MVFNSKFVCTENFNTVIYIEEDKEINIYLYKNSNHIDLINSMKVFYGSHYCKNCDEPYKNKK